MKLRSIDVVGLQWQVPEANRYGAAVGIGGQRNATLIRIRTDEGIEGIGDSRAPVGLVRANMEMLRVAFVGTDILDRDITFTRLLNRQYHNGMQGPLIAAYSGLNIAMLDALGKGLGLPVCKLIGGMARREVTAYATGGYMTPKREGFEHQLERIRQSGLSTAKIKIGTGTDADEARVAQARRFLGDDIVLAVDANANYTADLALESMRRIAPYRVQWYEEPVKPHDVRGYAHLRRSAPMAISAGESHYLTYDFHRLLENGCIDIAQPAVCACGGLDEARRIAELCRLYSVRVLPAAWSSGVGLAAAVHFAAALPPSPHVEFEPVPQMVEYDVGENPLRDEILAEPLRLNAGKLAISDSPGLGIALNEDALRRYRVE